MSSVPAQGFNVAVAVPFQSVGISGNSSTIGNSEGLNMGVAVTVSSATGTLPTLNVILQTSQDNGATWTDIWHFEQMTAPGTSNMPFNKVAGLHRYVWNIGGTTPDFTFEITETASAQDAPLVRRFFDYTAGLLAGTVAADGATFDVTGCALISATVTLATAATPQSYYLDLSQDGINWLPSVGPVLGIANSTIALNEPAGTISRFARLRCASTSSPSQTGIVASIMAR